jgi:hypothetical protein
VTAKKRGSRARPRHEWSDLVQPFRRYRAADAPPTWEGDFKLRVDEIAAIFSDKETPLAHWLRSVQPAVQEILTKATRSQIGIFLSLLPYLPSGRTGHLPLPAQTRELLAKVRDDSIKLIDSLQAAIADPLMQFAEARGLLLAGRLRERSTDLFPRR